jgi:hypothetical protein
MSVGVLVYGRLEVCCRERCRQERRTGNTVVRVKDGGLLRTAARMRKLMYVWSLSLLDLASLKSLLFASRCNGWRNQFSDCTRENNRLMKGVSKNSKRKVQRHPRNKVAYSIERCWNGTLPLNSTHFTTRLGPSIASDPNPEPVS